MDQAEVRKMEDKLEEAIAEVVTQMGLRELPLLPSQKAMHLMAKAAVTVFESAVANHSQDRRR